MSGPEALGDVDFVGAEELGRLVGISRERVRQLRHLRDAGGEGEGPAPLPLPIYTSARGDEVYRVEDVWAWAEETGRTFRRELLQ